MSQDRGARPKVKSERSKEGRPGGRRKARGSQPAERGSLSPREAVAGGGHEGPEPSGRSVGRSLRQKLQAAVGQCFPIKSASRWPEHASQRKIHLRELMLDTCPFPPGSELAHTWNLIKQHTAPVSEQEALGPPLPPPTEDEDARLRERRRISIEQGVEPPPDALIHTFEVTAQINPLYKLGPKLAHGMTELAGAGRAALAAADEGEEEGQGGRGGGRRGPGGGSSSSRKRRRLRLLGGSSRQPRGAPAGPHPDRLHPLPGAGPAPPDAAALLLGGHGPVRGGGLAGGPAGGDLPAEGLRPGGLPLLRQLPALRALPPRPHRAVEPQLQLRRPRSQRLPRAHGDGPAGALQGPERLHVLRAPPLPPRPPHLPLWAAAPLPGRGDRLHHLRRHWAAAHP
ncbi:uncharacterized protein LOC110075737 isoform X1 [Pogona vitticeps]